MKCFLFKTIFFATIFVFLVSLKTQSVFAQYLDYEKCRAVCTECSAVEPGKFTCSKASTIINPIAPNLSPSSGSAAVGLFSKLIQSLVSTLIIVAAIVFFFMFLIGAIKWITSSGDKAQVESARGTILNALVGLVIVFSIFALLTLLEKLFKINILQIDAGALKIR